MAEKLAELRQKGGGISSNIFAVGVLASPATSWTNISFGTTANIPSGSSSSTILDPNYGHINNGSIVIDKAIPKAFISGQAYRVRNTSGPAVYLGLRVLKNGTVIDGASIMGSADLQIPSFRRVQTSFAVGDIISVQHKATASISQNLGLGTINIVTDD